MPKNFRRITFQAPTSSLFTVNGNTGEVRTKASLDYESGITTHHLRILANTSAHSRPLVVNLQILTESQDEYAPQVFKFFFIILAGWDNITNFLYFI